MTATLGTLAVAGVGVGVGVGVDVDALAVEEAAGVDTIDAAVDASDGADDMGKAGGAVAALSESSGSTTTTFVASVFTDVAVVEADELLLEEEEKMVEEEEEEGARYRARGRSRRYSSTRPCWHNRLSSAGVKSVHSRAATVSTFHPWGAAAHTSSVNTVRPAKFLAEPAWST